MHAGIHGAMVYVLAIAVAMEAGFVVSVIRHSIPIPMWHARLTGDFLTMIMGVVALTVIIIAEPWILAVGLRLMYADLFFFTVGASCASWLMRRTPASGTKGSAGP